MPLVSLKQDLHFQFDRCFLYVNLSIIYVELKELGEIPNSQSSFWRKWRATTPVLLSGISIFGKDFHVVYFLFYVQIVLELPESPQNEEVGMFNTHVSLFNPEGALLLNSSRSVYLTFAKPILNN